MNTDPTLSRHATDELIRQLVQSGRPVTPEEAEQTVRSTAARLAVYERRGGYLAAVVVATEHVLPPNRLGERPLPELLVVYSADRGIILSGYQITGLETASIPEEVRWLR